MNPIEAQILQYKLAKAAAEATNAEESLAAERALNKIRVAEAKADLAAHRKRLNNRVAVAEAARRARAAAAPPPHDTSGGQTRDEDIGPAVMREMLMEVAAWAGYKDKAA